MIRAVRHKSQSWQFLAVMAILVIVGSIISAPSPVFGSFHNYLQSDFAEAWECYFAPSNLLHL